MFRAGSGRKSDEKTRATKKAIFPGVPGGIPNRKLYDTGSNCMNEQLIKGTAAKKPSTNEARQRIYKGLGTGGLQNRDKY